MQIISPLRNLAFLILSFLLMQFLVVISLGEPGYPGPKPDKDMFKPAEYFSSFKPHIVALYLLVIFAIPWTIAAWNLKKIPARLQAYLPLLLIFAYLIFLLIFVSSDRIYQDPDFRDGPVYIDPFQVFFIPFYLSLVFIVFPIILVVVGLIFWNSKTNRG